MLNFGASLDSFLNSFFGFLNGWLDGLFLFLADLFGGLSVIFPAV
jgi:hypothetical protein